MVVVALVDVYSLPIQDIYAIKTLHVTIHPTGTVNDLRNKYEQQDQKKDDNVQQEKPAKENKIRENTSTKFPLRRNQKKNWYIFTASNVEAGLTLKLYHIRGTASRWRQRTVKVGTNLASQDFMLQTLLRR